MEVLLVLSQRFSFYAVPNEAQTRFRTFLEVYLFSPKNQALTGLPQISKEAMTKNKQWTSSHTRDRFSKFWSLCCAVHFTQTFAFNHKLLGTKIGWNIGCLDIHGTNFQSSGHYFMQSISPRPMHLTIIFWAPQYAEPYGGTPRRYSWMH